MRSPAEVRALRRKAAAQRALVAARRAAGCCWCCARPATHGGYCEQHAALTLEWQRAHPVPDAVLLAEARWPRLAPIRLASDRADDWRPVAVLVGASW